MASKRRSINEYQQLISVYIKRRNAYKALYGLHSKEYKEKASFLGVKIQTWRVGMRSVRKRTEKIDSLIKDIYDFMGVDLKKNPPPMANETKIAKGIYFKWGMENGIGGVSLEERINMFKNAASKRRMKFIRAFAKSPETKNSYLRFLEFMKRSPENRDMN